MADLKLTALTEALSINAADQLYAVIGGNSRRITFANFEGSITPANIGAAAASHVHDTADITTGTFLNARIAVGNVTQHQGSLVITEAQISDLGNYAVVGHTHTTADLTDFSITAVAPSEVLQWNGADWINRTLAEAGIAAASHTHTLTDITDSGALAALSTVSSTEIDNNAVTNAKLADMVAWSVKCRDAATGGDPTDETATTLTEDATPVGGDKLLGWLSTGELRVFDVGNLPTGGGGEANTASNVGTGTGVFKQKTGVNLEFNNIKSETNRLTVALDGVTNDIELTVNEANLVITESQISDLGNYSVVGHTHTLTDITDSGALAALNTVGTAQIDNNAVDNTKLSDMAAWSIKARDAATSGDPTDETASTLTEDATPVGGDKLLGWVSTGELRIFDVGNLPTGGGGEANTASNVGTGVGVFKQKTGINLEFNNIKSENNRLTVALDGVTNDIELTVVEANLSITESQISDLGTSAALVTDNLSVFAATTSAQLAGVISDNTGSGALVFGTSPTIATPVLTLTNSAAPTPTAEGRIEWDTDDDAIKVGDGTGTVTFSNDTTNATLYQPLGQVAGQIQANSGRTVVAGDAGSVIYVNNAAAQNVTINTSVLSANDVIHVVQEGAGQVTINGTATINVDSGFNKTTKGQNAMISVVMKSASVGTVTGMLDAV